MRHILQGVVLLGLVGLLAVLGVQLTSTLTARGSAGMDAVAAADARLSTVRTASTATIPAAIYVAADPAETHGARSASGPLVTYALFMRRRLDCATVPVADKRGGPLEPLLELARAQERALAVAGFCPVSAEWSTTGREDRIVVEDPTDPMGWGPDLVGAPRPEGAPPGRPTVHVSYARQSDSGSGRGGCLVDLADPVIVHRRVYLVPQSGATLFVRNAYVQATRIIEVELSYSDRTLSGVEYPTGSHIVGRAPGHYRLHETIDLPE
jgi:hypothetical protein